MTIENTKFHLTRWWGITKTLPSGKVTLALDLGKCLTVKHTNRANLKL